LLGQQDELDSETRDSFASAGVMHVLAVSGLHLGIIMLILTFVLKPIKKVRYGKQGYLVLILLIIWFFAFFTGLSPSVFRAAVMFSFIIVGMEMQRETSIYQSLMVSAFILIICDPYIIFQIGFQLSYLAVLSIVYIQPKIYKLIYIPNRWLDKTWQILAVSLAAQIGTFPLSIYYFHQFPNYFLLSNVLIIPLTFIVLMVALVYVITIWIPILSEMMLWILDFCLSLMNGVVGFIDQLAFSSTKGLYLTLVDLLILYLALWFIIRAFVKKSGRILIMGMLTILSFVSLQLYEMKELSGSNEIVFYSTSKGVAVDIWYGRQNVFIASKSIRNDDRAIDFSIRNNWNYRHGNADPTRESNPDSARIFRFGSNVGCFVDSSLIRQERVPINPDLVYLYDIDYLPGDLISLWADQTKYLVIGSGVSYTLQNYLSYLVGNKVKNLKIDGAFVLEF